MDALPPPPPPPELAPSAIYAPGDIYPRGDKEKELCEKAAGVDWLYISGAVALDVGSIALGTWQRVKWNEEGAFVGPALFGLSWGATIGGGYLSLPKCEPHFVGSFPREGYVRSSTPVALSLALLAGVSAPMIYGIANGTNLEGTTFERQMHVVTAGVMGAAGALLPYLLPPKTWRAARELQKIRLGADTTGVFIGYRSEF